MSIAGFSWCLVQHSCVLERQKNLTRVCCAKPLLRINRKLLFDMLKLHICTIAVAFLLLCGRSQDQAFTTVRVSVLVRTDEYHGRLFLCCPGWSCRTLDLTRCDFVDSSGNLASGVFAAFFVPSMCPRRSPSRGDRGSAVAPPEHAGGGGGVGARSTCTWDSFWWFWWSRWA